MPLANDAAKTFIDAINGQLSVGDAQRAQNAQNVAQLTNIVSAMNQKLTKVEQDLAAHTHDAPGGGEETVPGGEETVPGGEEPPTEEPPNEQPPTEPPTGGTPPPTAEHVKPSSYLTIRTNGRQLTVNPNDNLKDMTANVQPHDQIRWLAGDYTRGDNQFKVPTQHKANAGVRFRNIGGAKGVFVMEDGADLNGQGLEADDAVTIFDGFNFEDIGLPSGSNNNFAAFRIGKGHTIIRNCSVDGAREGLLGQVYRGRWDSAVYEDTQNGKDIELVNCVFRDCGKDGLSHGVYTRARRFWIEGCKIWSDLATAPYRNSGYHDVKHLGSILDIHNSIIGVQNSNVGVPVDVSGHGGAVRITNSVITKSLWPDQPSGPNRHMFNFMDKRLGDNWADDHFLIDNCQLINWFWDPSQPNAAVKIVNTQSDTRLLNGMHITNSSIANNQTSPFQLLGRADNSNTFAGNIQR